MKEQTKSDFKGEVSRLKKKVSDLKTSVAKLKQENEAFKKCEKELQALREREEKYHAVMQQSTACIFLADINTRVILEANSAMQRLLGYSQKEIIGLSLYDFVHEHEGIYQKILKTLSERRYFIGEHKYIRKSGALVDVEISVNYLTYRKRKVFCVVSRDITSRKLAEKQLIYTATHDPLTGLTNRLVLYDRLAQELARARRGEKMISLLFIDLDNFKEVNDSLGHAEGDKLLRAVGIRLKSFCRASDTLARMGGDEYMIILGDIEKRQDIDRIAMNILEAFREPFDFDGHSRQVTASIGISIYPLDGKDSEILIRTADLAMYRAKNKGRNSYEYYSS